jgi:hypothetical protein
VGGPLSRGTHRQRSLFSRLLPLYRAFGAADPLVGDHALYRGLGGSLGERRGAYRALFEPPVDPALFDGLRAATNGGWALGDERFQRRLGAAVGRRPMPLPRGRRRNPGNEPRPNRVRRNGVDETDEKGV